MSQDTRVHTYKCGHLSKPIGYSYTSHGLSSLGADSMALAQQDCPDCYLVKALAQRQDDVAYMTGGDSSVIRGTPKQVDWARNIMARQAMSVAKLKVCLTRLQDDPTAYLRITTELMPILKNVNRLYRMCDAVFIINHREWDILQDARHTLSLKGMTLEGLS